MVFIPAESSAKHYPPDLVIVINRGRLLCNSGESWRPLKPDVASLLGDEAHRHYLGTLDGQHIEAIFFRLSSPPDVAGYEWQDLREQLGVVSEELFQLAGRALQITRWYRNHQFCGVCGARNLESNTDRALVCPQCDARFYPRISPCVIGLVKRGNMCLLARGVRHPEGLYSTLAGFVEPGESAEQAFAREVKEEVDLDIQNVKYFGSQPWPFPGQLMLGFTADYRSGEIRCDEREIIDAQWYSFDALPRVPPKSTIAGMLVRDFMNKVRG